MSGFYRDNEDELVNNIKSARSAGYKAFLLGVSLPYSVWLKKKLLIFHR